MLTRCVALAALAACGHGEPMRIPDQGTDVPLEPGTPTRLTYNAGVDRDPVWLPDESGLLYSSDQLDRTDDDRCLVLLPPDGGRISRRWCNNADAARDSFNTFDAAAPGAGGLLAFVRTSRLLTQTFLRFNEFVVANQDSVAAARVLTGLPFTLSGVTYGSVSRISWLAGDRLVFRGDFSGTVCTDLGIPCTLAPVTSGLDLLTLTVGSSGPPVAIAGTALASSVAIDPAGDALFYTLQNDNRIFRLVISTGTSTVVHSFPPGTIVRDVQVAGARLVAVIDGTVTILTPPVTNPGTPPLQWDRGGILVVVDLASGDVTPLNSAAILYLRPAVSPSGTRLVAEARGDLWLFTLP